MYSLCTSEGIFKLESVILELDDYESNHTFLHIKIYKHRYKGTSIEL